MPIGRAWSPKKSSGTGSKRRREKEQLSKSQYSDSWIVLEGDDVTGGDHRVADRAIAMLRAYRDEPFFLACGFSKPHNPLSAPQPRFRMWMALIPLQPRTAAFCKTRAKITTTAELFLPVEIIPGNMNLFSYSFLAWKKELILPSRGAECIEAPTPVLFGCATEAHTWSRRSRFPEFEPFRCRPDTLRAPLRIV